MFSRLVRDAAPFALLLAAPAFGQAADPPITPAELRAHIDQLASDAFQGRAPGTEGERLTINYIAEQYRSRGLEPAGDNGTWFQSIRMIERTPETHEVRWTANGRPASFDQRDIYLNGREAETSIADAPIIFAGHGARIPARGIDQLAGANISGAIVLILAQGPSIPDFPSLERRVQAVAQAGAAGVIVVTSVEWSRDRNRPSPAPPVPEVNVFPPVLGVMPVAAFQQLVAAGGGDAARLLNDQPGSSFRAVSLALRVSITARTRIQRFTTNNVVGRLRGSRSTGESILFLSHWDHLGICRPEGEADRVCNGAVDNASGIASLIEIAGRLGQGSRPVRDILFLATTAEEIGLRGAEYFAAHPTVPAGSIIAAVNMDTVALHPAGTPVAVLGRGLYPALDSAVDQVTAQLGRRPDTDDEANVMVRRQDGWKLNEAGIPTIMVGGSFSDMALLNAFLGSNYHRPSDQPGSTLVLDGAAEDATLLVALGRRLADPQGYRRPAAPQATGD